MSRLFTEDFNGSSLNSNYWNTVGSVTVSGGNVVFGPGNGIRTLGKVALSGSAGLVITTSASIVSSGGYGYDYNWNLIDEDGDQITFGDTSYVGGLFLYASGKYSIPQAGTGNGTTNLKVYRLTVVGTSIKIERGDTVETLNEIYSATLSASIVGHTFYFNSQAPTGSYANTNTYSYFYVDTVYTKPSVTTLPINNLVFNSVTANGNVTLDNGYVISERGFVYNTTGNPTISDSKSIVSGTTGSYSSSITSLIPGTTYYLKAYAINYDGVSYGSEVSFSTGLLSNDSLYKNINGIAGQTYAVQLSIGGTTGTVSIKLGSTGIAHTYNAGAGTVFFKDTYSGSNGIIISHSGFNGYIDNVYWVAVVGDTEINWALSTLTNIFAINSSVLFKRLEDKEFNTFLLYRYLDLMFKDSNAYVTVTIKQERNNVTGEKTSTFVVDNSSDADIQFVKKKISFLSKNQAILVGFSNNAKGETFKICKFDLRGYQENKRLFRGADIISIS